MLEVSQGSILNHLSIEIRQESGMGVRTIGSYTKAAKATAGQIIFSVRR
jgi:hypothetical protein